MARIAAHLAHAPLGGFTGEGASPYGSMDVVTDNALTIATFCGFSVVKCGRGNTGGIAHRFAPVFVAGNNLTSSKARMITAALLKLGPLPAAADPRNPTEHEIALTPAAIAESRTIFDTH